MPDINVGIAAVSYEVNYPNIYFEIDLEIPDEIPKVGGKKFSLESFSLSITQPTITIPVNLELFGGSISVGLDFTRCEVQISGKVDLDVVVHTFHWNIGPVNISYMTPLSFVEPSWSVNPTQLSASQLQSLIDSAPSPTIQSGPPVLNDSATQEALAALLTFAGCGDLIQNLTKSLGHFNTNLQLALADKPITR